MFQNHPQFVATIGLGLSLGLLLHCRSQSPTPPDEAAPFATGQPGKVEAIDAPDVEPTEDVAPSICSPEGVDFIDFRWLPDGLQLAVHVDLRRREALDRAFFQLAQLLENDERRAALRLPILAAFELKQLRLHTGMQELQWQSQSLRLQSLVFLRAQSGESGWVLAHDCDVNRLSHQLAEAWQLELRDDAKSRVASAQVTSPLASDLLFGPGPRIYACPRGESRRYLAWLSRPRPDPAKRLTWFQHLSDQGISVDPNPPESRPLITVEWRDEGLLSIDDEETEHTSAASSPLLRRLELTADGVRIDGRLMARP